MPPETVSYTHLDVYKRQDEGMWIPLLIEKYNIELMREKGFRLSAEDIYSVNRACMKDAIVLFGGGCTGEMISPDGLLPVSYTHLDVYKRQVYDIEVTSVSTNLYGK